MGCSCSNGFQPASYIPGENYGIYGYLPTLTPPTITIQDILQSALVIGGIAGIAYLAVHNAEKTKAAARKQPKWVGKKFVL